MPTVQHFVELRDTAFERDATGAARGQFADSPFELVLGLVPRPAVVAFEVVAEEVETTLLGDIDDARFPRMQLQAVFRDPRLHADQGGFSRVPASTEDDEVVGVAYHLAATFGHEVVQRIEIDVSQ